MSVDMDALQESGGRKKRLLINALLIALVIHVGFGIFAGLWVVVAHFTPPEATFVSKQIVAIPPEIVDPKLAAAEFDSAAKKPVLDQKLASLREMDFALPDVPMADVAEVVEFDPSSIAAADVSGMVSGAGGTGGGNGGGAGGYFGASTYNPQGLRGVFYDLKRRRQGGLSEIGKSVKGLEMGNARANRSFTQAIRAFTDSGLNPEMMSEFFRADTELFATTFFFPEMDAISAPKEFGVDSEGRYWFVHYSGKVAVPESGRYRFAGSADNLLVVFIDGRPVLDASKPSNTSGTVRWTPSNTSEDIIYGAPEYVFRPGDWLSLSKGQVIELDILIGETPGGGFSAFLTIESDQIGVRYTKNSLGIPNYPLFRTADTRLKIDVDTPVDYVSGGPIFKGAN